MRHNESLFSLTLTYFSPTLVWLSLIQPLLAWSDGTRAIRPEWAPNIQNGLETGRHHLFSKFKKFWSFLTLGQLCAKLQLFRAFSSKLHFTLYINWIGKMIQQRTETANSTLCVCSRVNILSPEKSKTIGDGYTISLLLFSSVFGVTIRSKKKWELLITWNLKISLKKKTFEKEISLKKELEFIGAQIIFKK